VQLLPDLTPWASEADNYIYGWRIQGDQLRLTTAMANIGLGNLEVRGGAILADGSQEVHQRIYNDDGTFTDRLAGTFEYHDTHGHIHFEDFAHFRLRLVTSDGGVGEVIAQGDKVSFCLIDVDQLDPLAGARTYGSCGQIQGISSGWADVYSSGLPGQSIDIAGVPDGQYWLEVEVDPLNRLVEADETNNVTRILITLDRETEPPVGSDAFEQNDSLATGSILAPPEDHLYENLSIHDSNDADFFRFTASATGILSFRIDFQHSLGDLDMRVFDAAGNLLANSIGVTNSETISVQASEGDQFTVQIYGYNGATGNYSLLVDQPDRRDDFEPNDTLATAAFLDASEPVSMFVDMSVHSGDQDYFWFVAENSGLMKVHLDFHHEDGDINARILDADGGILTESLRDSTAIDPDHEHLQFEAVAGQDYFLFVFGANDQVANPHYSIMIEQPEMNIATFNGSTYIFVGSSNRWSEAQAIAASVGGHLLRIESQAENDFIMQSFWNDQAIFLDASDAATEGLFTYSDGRPLTYDNWRPGEPNNYGGIQDYARIADDQGRWDDGWDGSVAHRGDSGWESDGTAMVIVEIPDHPALITFEGSAYEVIGSTNRWTTAQEMAAEAGGRLLEIESQAENNFIMAAFWEDQAIFLDASDAANEGNFVNSDGELLACSNWRPGEPNNFGGIQDYARIADDQGRWDDGWDGSVAHRGDSGWESDGTAMVIVEYDLLA
jgi:hypothetical protein